MNETLSALIIALGGAYAAADAAGVSRAWIYKCIGRGYLPADAAWRMLKAADASDPGAWPESLLAELTVDPAVRDALDGRR